MGKKLAKKIAKQVVKQMGKSGQTAAKKTTEKATAAKKPPTKPATQSKKVIKSAPKKLPVDDVSDADKKVMAEVEKYAGKKAEKTAEKKAGKGLAESSFAMLERDLPKGAGKALKVAEELAPGQAEKAALSRVAKAGAGKTLKRLGAGAAVGGVAGLGLTALMEGLDAEELNPGEDAEAAERAQYGDVARPEKLAKTLPVNMKGNPEFIDKSGSEAIGDQLPSKKREIPQQLPQTVKKVTADEKFLNQFNAEKEKHFGPDDGKHRSRLHVTVREGADGPVVDQYVQNLTSDDPISGDDELKAAGLHYVGRSMKGVKKPAKGTINRLPDFSDDEE